MPIQNGEEKPGLSRFFFGDTKDGSLTLFTYKGGKKPRWKWCDKNRDRPVF
jgi:hypothetical protein